MGLSDILNQRDAAQIILTIVCVAFLYGTVTAASRLYFHPLSKFPGPRLAAITRWYEFYHDVVQDGTYVKHYPALHKQHGPIVRVGPNHLHVDDPDFYREVFRAQTPYLKAGWFYENLGIDDSLVGICNPHKHRIHRSITNPLFSAAALTRTSPLVGEIVGHAARITKERLLCGQAVDIQKLFRCITVDVISLSCFGHTQDLTTQDQKDVYPEFLTSVDMFTGRMWLTKHFSILATVALHLPPSWAEVVAPGYAHFRSQCAQWIQGIKDRREKGITQTEDGRDTVFDLLLEPNAEKGYQVPTMNQLVDEGFLLLVAGSDTTAYTMACATYYILTHRDVERKLKEELSTVPTSEGHFLAWKDISDLPYLTAVVKESLRVSSGIPGILPRIVPPGGVEVQGQFIPAGTSVSISARTIHDNPDLFPSPEQFDPDRWLGHKGKELEKWMVAFSKGPRACIGLGLAYIEIYMTIATFFSQFDLELFETDDSSMQWLDHGVAQNKSYVKVKGTLANQA